MRRSINNLLQLFSKLYIHDADTAIRRIDTLYSSQHFCCVNFVYWAQISLQHVPSNPDSPYVKALYESDLLLPDGIALQLVYWIAHRTRIPNLNGTDFTPHVLQYFSKKYNGKLSIYLFGSKDYTVRNAEKYLLSQWYNVVYAQHGYVNFDRDRVAQTPSDHVAILLVGRGAPRQEIWMQENLEHIKKKKLIAMGVWWLFEFRSGDEERSPVILRKLKLEWLWRLFQNPRKNFSKVVHSFSFVWWMVRMSVWK